MLALIGAREAVRACMLLPPQLINAPLLEEQEAVLAPLWAQARLQRCVLASAMRDVRCPSHCACVYVCMFV